MRKECVENLEKKQCKSDCIKCKQVTIDFEEEKFKYLKFRLPEIQTMAMIKMEKNFIAHMEKGYSRQPYKIESQPLDFLINRIEDELKELKYAWSTHNLNMLLEELADISNYCDYAFEKTILVRNKKKRVIDY